MKHLRILEPDHRQATLKDYLEHRDSREYVIQELRYFLFIFPYWKTIDTFNKKTD